MNCLTQLGYLVFEVRDPAAWQRFGADVLGLGVHSQRPDGSFRMRMDEHAQRFFVESGQADDLVGMGWQAADEFRLAEQVERLRMAGIKVVERSAADCEARGVERLFACADPAGIQTELYLGAAPAEEPFKSALVRSGFVAGALGCGHAVISAPNPAENRRFYCELLGLKKSDRIVTEIHGHAVDLEFFHINSRHHSVAFGGPQKKRMHHFMVEVRAMDDVGLAFDRALKNGVRIMQTLGRHPNDRMFSFYAKTPSGFQFEYGWGGREVDDATWQPTEYDRISEWGHHPPEFLAPSKPANGRNA